MDIDTCISKGWFEIANGLNSFIKSELWPLTDVKMWFSSISSEQMNEF